MGPDKMNWEIRTVDTIDLTRFEVDEKSRWPGAITSHETILQLALIALAATSQTEGEENSVSSLIYRSIAINNSSSAERSVLVCWAWGSLAKCK